MNRDSPDIEMLRRAFAAIDANATPTARCPEPERIWAATGAELPAVETHEIVDHIAACPACAEAWRLAADLVSRKQETATVTSPTSGARPIFFRQWGALAASIAAVAIGAAIVYMVSPFSKPDEPVYRQIESDTIRALVDERTPLPRERCVLRWSPGPKGTTYRVRVASDDLKVIATAQDLRRAEYEVPASALRSLPSGARLLWQVEAMRPDGGRLVSQTFIVVVH